MRRNKTIPALIVCLLALPLAVSGLTPQETQDKPPAEGDMMAMMAKAQKYIKPGEQHKLLEKFLGKWNTETRVFMGGKGGPAEKGTSEGRWLIKDRWVQMESKGTIMGMQVHMVSTMGYDNFKMSYVTANVSSFDTAQRYSEGDLDPGGKVLITYGTVDEYLTGEHDKMCKYVWRFESDDKIVFEIHDLPIGLKHTKVVEIVSTRAKE